MRASPLLACLVLALAACGGPEPRPGPVSAAAPSRIASVDGAIALRCEHTSEISRGISYTVIDIDLERRTLVERRHFTQGAGDSPTAVRHEIVGLSESEILAAGLDPRGRASRWTIDRRTGYARSDFRLSAEDKARAWNEATGRVGYPVDEEVWMGSSHRCTPVGRIF